MEKLEKKLGMELIKGVEYRYGKHKEQLLLINFNKKSFFISYNLVFDNDLIFDINKTINSIDVFDPDYPACSGSLESMYEMIIETKCRELENKENKVVKFADIRFSFLKIIKQKLLEKINNK